MIKLIWWFLKLINLASHVELALNVNYLRSKGWFLSYKSKNSIDKNGNPIPWFTYPIISFLEYRLNKKMNLFEYGCGNSTLFFAQRVKSIISVEHNNQWYNQIKTTLPKNANLVFQNLEYGKEYSKQVLIGKKKYNLIIIDGRDRNNCIKNSVTALTKDGVIVFDNSQLVDYKIGMDFLAQKGFKRLDFWGQIPIAAHENCTSIFYKSNNSLNI